MIHHLNDEKELQLALDLAHSHIAGCIPSATRPRAQLLTALDRHLEQVSRINIFVFSLSAEGKKAKLIGRFLRIGSLDLELWQPIRGDTVQQEFLDSCGEGVNHIAFTVEDYDKEYANLVEKQGIRLVFGSKPPIAPSGGGGYFDTRKEGHNIILELMTPFTDREVPEWLP